MSRKPIRCVHHRSAPRTLKLLNPLSCFSNFSKSSEVSTLSERRRSADPLNGEIAPDAQIAAIIAHGVVKDSGPKRIFRTPEGAPLTNGFSPPPRSRVLGKAAAPRENQLGTVYCSPSASSEKFWPKRGARDLSARKEEVRRSTNQEAPLKGRRQARKTNGSQETQEVPPVRDS